MGITPPPRHPHDPLGLPAAMTRASHGGSDAARGVRRGLLVLLLALVLAVGLVPTVPSQAFGAVVDSDVDGGCTWTYDGFTKVLTIMPTPGENGRLSDSDATPQRKWRTACSGPVESISVQNGVTAAGNMRELFSGMSAAASIVLPLNFDQGITNAQSMFDGCEALKGITFPKGFGGSITNATNMFSNCTVLEDISLPDDFGGETMQTDNMFDNSPLLSIVYLGKNCNGSVLAQVPNATRNEYANTWVRVTDPNATYESGKAPSELPADYESANKPVSTCARQHARGFKMKAPKTTAAATTNTIQIIIGDPVPPDAFGSYTIDGIWQEDSLFTGLKTFSTHDNIKARFSSAAYDTDAVSDPPLSVTTLGLITYEANGGSGATENTKGDPDKSFAPAAACTFTRPQSQYKRFKEWNTLSDGKGTSYKPGDQVSFVTGGNTLYAVWEDYVPPKITTTDLPTAKTGDSYHQKLTASGDEPITWSVATGELPAGLTLSPDGIISGIPSAKGVFTFTAKVANDLDDIDTADYTITVVGPPVITVSSDTLPAAEPGKPYRFHFTSDEDAPATDASALPGSANSLANAPGVSSDALAVDSTLNATGVSWSLEAGALPDGLSLAPDGKLSGTPHDPGTYTFTVKATNRYGSTAQTFHLAVNSPVTLVATGDDLAGATASLVALSLFCAGSMTALSLRRRARRR